MGTCEGKAGQAIPAGQFLLELLYSRPQHIRAAFQYLLNGLIDLSLKILILANVAVEAYFGSRHMSPPVDEGYLPG